MEERLREYVNALFADMPDTARATEVRDEIYANVLDRYHDLVSSGMTPQAAYDEAKQSIGDTEDIRRFLEEREPDMEACERNRKWRAAFIGTGVGCLLLAVGFVILLGNVGAPVIGVFLMFVFIALGVGLLIYGSVAYGSMPASRIPISDATEYQQWKAEKMAGEKMGRPYRSLLWLLVTIAYFLISFSTGSWGISWVIFLIGAAIEKLIEVVLS